MLAINSKGVIKVGQRVSVCEKTGSSRIIKGEVGEIKGDGFYVWQNEYPGAIGSESPSTKGYNNSWYVGFSDANAEISIIGHSGHSVGDEKSIKEARDVIKKHKK